MKEQESNLTDEEKTSLNSLVESMKNAVKDKNVDEINKLEQEINNKWNEISTRIYQNQSQQNTQTEQHQQENNEENIQEANFEEV